MAFIEPMHRNKPNITYLLTRPGLKKLTDYFMSCAQFELVWVVSTVIWQMYHHEVFAIQEESLCCATLNDAFYLNTGGNG